MSEEPPKLPDGRAFEPWDDRTKYTKVYHVACEDPRASDDSPGTPEEPFKTIGRAAEILAAGEKVIIHGGIYRERVRPARGGEGPERMIAYEAAAGERVEVRGSRIWQPEFVPSAGWSIPGAGAGKVWMADIPEEFFVGYNPFGARNVCDHFFTFDHPWNENRPERERALLRRGMVFHNGRRLRQVLWIRDLGQTDGAFCVAEPGTRIHLRLPGDADPAGAELEVTTAEQVFAPRRHHLGYVRLSGLGFAHAADGVPVPQRAAVTTGRGHHWIIEDCSIRHANAVGLDVGAQDWRADEKHLSGSHVVRRNTITDCGVCGIAGAGGVDHTLVEDNLIERIGGLDVEHVWESAGLKFHTCQGVLIRRNAFRRIRGAGGVWLDCVINNCRVTGNVFADIETYTSAVYLECAHFPNLVDGNVVWDIRGREHVDGTPGRAGGAGISADCNERTLVANNLIGAVPDAFAVSLNLNQKARVVGGRVGLCRGHRVFNNIITRCPKRIALGRAEENVSDGNLFDASGDAAAFQIEYPAPAAVLDLAGWREFYGFDRSGAAAEIEADFDPDTLELTLKVAGRPPTCRKVEQMPEASWQAPGPLTGEDWRRLTEGSAVTIRFAPAAGRGK